MTRPEDERAPGQDDADGDGDVAAGTTIGRYAVLYRHGRGGMGHVYAAYDPELDRKVAIKLLRRVGTSRRQKRAHARLLREAQALARLSHPNVVSIHDVGEHEERVFVAMEFLEGLTLRRWVDAETRSAREIVEVFVEAGRGLAAAHAAGLVHRDFKPDNVIVGADGKAQVLDFGLARVGVEAQSGDTERPQDDTDDSMSMPVPAPMAPLTREGAIVGTPAYMSPEQLTGGAADQRSDQFAFSVALYEALYGQHPFVADETEDLRRAVLGGRVRDAPRDRAVPGWLRAAILRGLHVDPNQRYRNMERLMVAISRDPWRRRRRIALGITTLGLAAGVAYVGGRRLAAQSNRCDGAAEIIARVWNEEQRAAAQSAFAATDKPYAATTWHTTALKLDEYAAAWTHTRTEVCEATWVNEEVPEEVLVLRLGCLERRLEEFSSLASLFANADDTVVERAVQAVHGLDPASTCRDVLDLTTGDERLSAPQRATASRLRRELAQASSLEFAGKYPQGLAIVDRVASEAQVLGHVPLQAEALLLQGRLRQHNGDTDGAERSLRDAVFAAEAGNAMALGARAWIELLDIARLRPQLHEEATQWERHAGALIDRLGRGTMVEARFHHNLGKLRYAQGRYDEAIDLHRRALELRERFYGREHVRVGESLRGLGTALEAGGQFAEAVEVLQRAETMLEGLLGPDHPEVARVLTDLAIAFDDVGEHDRARPLYEQAVEIFEQAHGPDHPKVAAALNNLAGVLFQDREFDSAGVLFGRALTIWETTYGPEHPDVALTLGNLGLVAEAKHEFDQALAYHQRALTLREQMLGVEHPDVAVSLRNLGDLYQYLGRHPEALSHHRRALEIVEKALGPEHPRTATLLLAVGVDHHHLGDPRRALELYTVALRIRQNSLEPGHEEIAEAASRLGLAWLDLDSPQRARAHLQAALATYETRAIGFAEKGRTEFALARLLWAEGGEARAQALTLARAARDDYREDPFGYPEEAKAVQAWLQRHDR